MQRKPHVMFVNVYRNLNKARRDPTRFVWSIAQTPLKADGTPGRGKGKVIGHADVVRIENPVAVCITGTLATIADKAERAVGAWIMGERVESEAPRVGHRQLITLNPLPESRGGRRSLVFTYCEVMKIHGRDKLVIGIPVDFSDVAEVEFTPRGAYAVIR